VWVALGKPGRLRDVPAPRETEPVCEGPAVQINAGGVGDHGGNALIESSGSHANRERELGLDRRETG
jgi:hypothetical protein